MTRKKATLLLLITVFLPIGIVSVFLCFRQVIERVSEIHRDFAALWNVTDALQIYVLSTQEWPKEWDCLIPSLQLVEPRYADDGISFLRQRVDVNFAVDMCSTIQDDVWYVRLRTDRMEGEEQIANDRLRSMIARIRIDGENDLNSH